MNIMYFTNCSESKNILQALSLSRFLVWSWPPPLPMPLFLPLKELTAPRFWRPPFPLRVAIWQWVAIQYLRAPHPGGGGGSHTQTKYCGLSWEFSVSRHLASISRCQNGQVRQWASIYLLCLFLSGTALTFYPSHFCSHSSGDGEFVCVCVCIFSLKDEVSIGQ